MYPTTVPINRPIWVGRACWDVQTATAAVPTKNVTSKTTFANRVVTVFPGMTVRGLGVRVGVGSLKVISQLVQRRELEGFIGRFIANERAESADTVE